MANQIDLTVTNRKLEESHAQGYTRKPIIQFNVLNDKIHIVFDAEWSGLDKVATFETDDTKIICEYTDLMYIPWECLLDYGRLYITIAGYDNDVMVLNTQRMETPLKIEESAPNDGTRPQEPTRSLFIRAVVAANYIEGMSATATLLAAGSNPTVTIDKTHREGYIINFGIPKGDKGDPGTTDHTQLINLDVANQHPISTIIGLADALDAKLAATHATDSSAHSSLFSAKQDVISDLATIRSGAQAGSTAAQPSDVASAVSTHNQSNSAHEDIRNSLSAHTDARNNPHEVTAAQAGADPQGTAASAVTAHNSSASAHQTEMAKKADLVNGKVPSSQLPSYVDDVVEVETFSDLPAQGETGKIYVTKDTNKIYRWTGTQYIEISSSLALGETSSTAYRGDRGKTAYDHSQTSGNPHNTTAAQVGADAQGTAASAVGAHDSNSGAHSALFSDKQDKCTKQIVTINVADWGSDRKANKQVTGLKLDSDATQMVNAAFTSPAAQKSAMPFFTCTTAGTLTIEWNKDKPTEAVTVVVVMQDI